MALNKPTQEASNRSGADPEFWQQLDRDFPFEGVDEDQLRQQTEQWITCASEVLGLPPSRVKNKTKR